MDTGVLVLLIALGVLGALGVAYLLWYLRKKRREELGTMASQLGLEFSAEDPFGCLSYPFALLECGDGQGTENVMWGVWQDLPVREFDFWYYNESTDSNGNTSRTYHRFSCAVAEIDASCSRLVLDRENVFTALADRIGMRDIEFESDAFNRAFNVKCKDRKFANDLLDARMMGWLLRVDGAFRFEVSGPFVMAYARRRHPRDLIPLLGTLRQFRQQVPRVVYELYPVA